MSIELHNIHVGLYVLHTFIKSVLNNCVVFYFLSSAACYIMRSAKLIHIKFSVGQAQNCFIALLVFLIITLL